MLLVQRASVNKNKYIFFSPPRIAFFKIVCGLYEEMLRSDENSRTISLTPFFKRGLCAIARRIDQALVQGLSAKTKAFMAMCGFYRTQ